MGWGDIARGTLKVINTMSGHEADSARRNSYKSNQENNQTSSVLRKEREMFDDFISSNADRPLIECKDDLRILINKFIEKAYKLGGSDMRDGLIDEVDRAGY